MEIPITPKDVQFLMLLVQRYLRKQQRSYTRTDQQRKLDEIYARGRYDAHMGSIERAETLLARLRSVVPLP